MRQEKRQPGALEMTSRGRRSKKSDPVGGLGNKEEMPGSPTNIVGPPQFGGKPGAT